MINLVERICVDGLTRTRQPRFASAALVAALERAWAAIRHQHPEVPAAVIVVAGSTTTAPRHGGLKLGHFAALRWQHHQQKISEVLVCGEGLKAPAPEVLTTLLHEAAHALAFARGIKDTSRQGRWHNQRFATLAAELGLHTSKDPKIGWSPSTLRPETTDTYRRVLADLARVLTAYRHPEPTLTTTAGGGTTTPSTIACRCDCGRRIRLSRSTFDAGPITCGICDNEFAPA